MARALRIEYPGAIYHVRSRGDHREPIFSDETDRQRLIETLGEACIQEPSPLPFRHYSLLVR